MTRINWQMWQGAVSSEECDALIKNLKDVPKEKGATYNDSNDIRKSNISWVADLNIKLLLWEYAQQANRVAFGFDVTSAGDVQFTEYSAEYEGKYDWHHDVDWKGKNAFDRKISLVLQLSDPNDYEGCDFEFFEVQNPEPKALKTRGTVICFPSYISHRVTEITKGTRHSLVAWFEGPRWR